MGWASSYSVVLRVSPTRVYVAAARSFVVGCTVGVGRTCFRTCTVTWNFLGELVFTRKIWVTSARERDFSPKLDVQVSAKRKQSIQRTLSKTLRDGSPGAHNLFSAMDRWSAKSQITPTNTHTSRFGTRSGSHIAPSLSRKK
jgi:hypothetical protein